MTHLSDGVCLLVIWCFTFHQTNMSIVFKKKVIKPFLAAVISNCPRQTGRQTDRQTHTHTHQYYEQEEKSIYVHIYIFV